MQTNDRELNFDYEINGRNISVWAIVDQLKKITKEEFNSIIITTNINTINIEDTFDQLVFRYDADDRFIDVYYYVEDFDLYIDRIIAFKKKSKKNIIFSNN